MKTTNEDSWESKKVAVELWKNHSCLFFRELKTAAVIQGSTLTGWFVVRREAVWMGAGVLVSGIMLLVVLALMLYRHADYITAFKTTAADLLPSVPDRVCLGRRLGVATPIVLAIIDFACLICWLLGDKAF